MSDTAEKAGFAAGIIETVKTVVYALLIAGIFRTLFFQPFWIPTGSMKDTLLIGDFLFVNKWAYGYSYASCPSIRIPRLGIDIDAEDFCGALQRGDGRLLGHEPERGDVVVFRHPVTGTDYIKRLIGLPGDRIQMIDGVVQINGVAVEIEDGGIFTEPSGPQGPQGSRPRCSNNTGGAVGVDCHKTRSFETLPNGVRHSILDIGPQSSDNTGVFTVPEGEYFFMGDNRDNSLDSRFLQTSNGVGFVPFADIVGRADRIMFSSAGGSMLAFWTWRSDRFFKAVE
ncbi:MAG: signal peptidase I [Rhodobacteraceae bacterium]|nr:signal peptidase I [Paracoccaceae bacterium]